MLSIYIYIECIARCIIQKIGYDAIQVNQSTISSTTVSAKSREAFATGGP
jgi:hypothetical protein